VIVDAYDSGGAKFEIDGTTGHVRMPDAHARVRQNLHWLSLGINSNAKDNLWPSAE